MKYNVYINADIGWPISAEYVRGKLKPYAGKPCSVYIHSYGGNVREALDIYQQFVDHGDITAYVFGLTASAATLIAMGAKKIVMSDKAMMLIHQASSFQFVWDRMNKDQIAQHIAKLQKDQETLDQIDNIAASIYAGRSGGRHEDFSSLMKASKWLTAKKCKEIGLCDEILEGGKTVKMSEELKEVMMSYNLPDAETQVEDVVTEENPVKRAFRSLAVACGFTLAEQPEATEETPAAVENNEPAEAEDNGEQEVLTQTNQNVMPKLETLMVALGVTALAVAENGSITLDASQAAAIDAALALAGNEKKRLGDENKQLKAQVEALQKADGGKTGHQGGENQDGEASMSVEQRAAAMLERVDKMIQ